MIGNKTVAGAALLLLLVLLVLLTVVRAAPQGPRFGPSQVYSYRFEGPDQTKEESRDALGNIRGSYSITYPDGGGTLSYSYAHPAQLPAFRTTSDGPLGPAGTIISFGTSSKQSEFLIEMLSQRLGSRDTPVITKTEAVLIEALPAESVAPAPTTVVDFKGAGESQPPQNTLTRPSVGAPGVTRVQQGFVNSKESSFLPAIRQESLENESLGGRNPPIIGDEEIIVEAADI